MKIFKIIPAVIILCALVSGCTQSLSPNTYNASDAGVAAKVEQGTVVGKRAVRIDNNSGMGGLAGAGVGAAAGSAVGGSSAANIVAAIGGAVVGGLAGNAIDKSVNQNQGFEYLVKLKKGSMISVVQDQEMQFNVHQRVLVIYGKKTRLVPDTTQS